MRTTTSGFAASAAIAVLLNAGVLVAGVEPMPWRPASLVTPNLVMHGGRPFIALSELARALGGIGRYDPARLRYEIQPGSSGVLLVNPGALATGPGANGHGTAGQNPLRLAFGAGEVVVPESEVVLLRPADPEISLGLLAGLLGGQARFDASKGFWVLPPGGPGTALRFR